MKYKPCYHHLVKDFWIRAHVHEIEIKSVILGVPISITQKLLAHVLQCPNEGIKVNKLSHANDLNDPLLGIFSSNLYV
jgi:hypothetical protein